MKLANVMHACCILCSTLHTYIHFIFVQFILFLYGGTVWSSTSKCNIRRIFHLQKKAARIILGLKMRDERTVTLFKRLDWLPFYDEIDVNKLCLLYKCLNGQRPEYLGSRLVRVSDLLTRTSRYGAVTIRCPKYNRDKKVEKRFLLKL